MAYPCLLSQSLLLPFHPPTKLQTRGSTEKGGKLKISYLEFLQTLVWQLLSLFIHSSRTEIKSTENQKDWWKIFRFIFSYWNKSINRDWQSISIFLLMQQGLLNVFMKCLRFMSFWVPFQDTPQLLVSGKSELMVAAVQSVLISSS